jgi:hypothetical protein
LKAASAEPALLERPLEPLGPLASLPAALPQFFLLEAVSPV